LLLSCTASPAGYDYHSGPDGSGGADRRALEDLNAPEPDGRSPWDTVPEDGPGGPDVSTDLTADGSSPEDLGTADAADTGKDTEAPPPCGDVEFTYSGPVEAEALVTGSFTGWAESAAAGALVMADPDGDGVWRVTTHLESGTYPYKLIVDGAWMTDPSNPVTADDGNGNVNSILVVDCPEPGSLVLQAHETIDDAFHAEFMVAGGAVAPGEVTVTVDYAAAPAGAVGVEEGGTILTVDLDGLATGIHDVRVTGPTGETLLLKVYVGVSTDWRDATLYFVMTDRFRNGDPGNDGPIPGCDSRTNYQGGDFAGVTNALEEGYFDELGVGALWLSWPVDNPETAEEGGRPSAHTCNMNPKTAQYTPVQFSGYHGYWPKDLYKVEERFGTMEELRELVTAAHARGIRVLLDFTANHVHTSSPFYQEHQGDGFFHFPVEICQDVGWDVKPVTCWFTEHLADLNYGNPATVEAVLDYAMFWAKETGSDGFRLDAVKHIEMGFIEALRARAKAEMELTGVDFYIVGETFTGDAGLINSFLGADRIHGQFDFPANYQILRGFATREVGLDAMDQAVRQ
ncbi:MAG: hypothetical protein FJ098_16060, partial [Deltaproteobacteria bacterium]|nr:hypothetical protein [Deltaproteobacteria bacterium]